MVLYINIISQTIKIFDLSEIFALNLINVIKKDKSFKKRLWIKNQVKELVAPLKCHIIAVKVGKT